MNNVNQTLYIPLYGKSYVSRKGLFLTDKKAEEIWEKEQFPLKGKSKSKWLAYYMGIRAAVFDDWLREQLEKVDDVVVLHIGCGMDSRVLRVCADKCETVENFKWYDVDFPDVIKERECYFTETSNYQMIPADVTQDDWLKQIDMLQNKTAVVVMEGVSMYLSKEELRTLLLKLKNNFKEVILLMDCYTTFAARMSKYKNPINDVGVTKVYGIDDPKEVEREDFKFVKKHSMTPQKYIEQLSGFERMVFEKFYAGKMSEKLYQLYEFKSTKEERRWK
jgi:O-methyltransferase involved in polyketide biosynthesis